MTSLISLNLNNNLIEIIRPGAFRGLIALLRLSINGNRIKTIDVDALNGIGGNLTRLNLGGNQLTRIPSQALKDLTCLQVNILGICNCYFVLKIIIYCLEIAAT